MFISKQANSKQIAKTAGYSSLCSGYDFKLYYSVSRWTLSRGQHPQGISQETGLTYRLQHKRERSVNQSIAKNKLF